MPAKDMFHELVRTALENEGVIHRNQIPLLVYNIEKQEITQWIS
jgi:hypothetical protein